MAVGSSFMAVSRGHIRSQDPGRGLAPIRLGRRPDRDRIRQAHRPDLSRILPDHHRDPDLIRPDRRHLPCLRHIGAAGGMSIRLQRPLLSA
ncbi:hypothetical protein LMG28688_05207 [Paraburkholderia caffeinitolerans]|uniref:Uncharacterized protein n=1 Tax=Paraburkholderia caffeinitolerans TaxID=1723730 RepID=A0A6J5GKD4_9BURK|nr:hypothetical protein LMG28688_05207 [Paraburkholderia caffeinitolerans]